MNKYISFGGGINSKAMAIDALKDGWWNESEAFYVDHGADWPETYQDIAAFNEWLKGGGNKPINILKPQVRTVEGRIFDNLYNYYWFKRLMPIRASKTCSFRFKQDTLKSAHIEPCFVYIGISYEEKHRSSPTTDGGREYRYPLIEKEIDRDGCIEIIKNAGLPVPPKSGCFICPWQPLKEYRRLRREHPELFCKAESLEQRYGERRISEGKKPLYIIKDIPLKAAIGENNHFILEELEYPPCHCGL